MNHEMYRQLFDTDIFIVQDHDNVISFGLSEHPPDLIKLLILLKDDDNIKADEGSIELLKKIADFKNYNLGREKIRVANLSNQFTSFLLLSKQFSSPNIVCFGISAGELGLQIDAEINQLICFAGVKLIFTESLQVISNNEKMKKQFFNEALLPMLTKDLPE